MYMHNAVSVQNLIFLHGIMFQIIMQNINNHSSGITHKKTMKILQNLFFSSYLYKPK